MATNEEIIAEIEELGRLTEEQELVLYNISLKQDELGRQASNMLLEKVIALRYAEGPALLHHVCG